MRRLVRPDIAPRLGRHVCWRFIADDSVGLDGWTGMLGNGRTLLAIPVGDGQVYVYADITLPAGADPESVRHACLPELFQDFSAPVFPLLERAQDDTPVHFSRLGEIVMDDWTHGNVVFIGDAAHAASPNMAQGAAMAIEDALVLAEMLGTGASTSAALAAYGRRRRDRVEWVQRQCRARDRTRALPGPVRAAVLGLLGESLYRRSYTPLLAPL